MTTGFAQVISPIRPKNNADFAIISAEHVSLTTTDDTRVSDILAGIHSNMREYVESIVQDAFDNIDDQYKPAAVMAKVDAIRTDLDETRENVAPIKMTVVNDDPTLTIVDSSNNVLQSINLSNGNTYCSGALGNDVITITATDGDDISVTMDGQGKVLDYYDAQGNKTFQNNVYAPNIDAMQKKIDDMYDAVQTLKSINSI